MKKLLPAMLLSAAVAAPALAQSPDQAASAQPGDEIARMLYACADNKTMDVVYVNTAGGTSFAILLEQDELLPMRQAVSASGAIYKAVDPDYTYELLTKGDMADLYATTDGKEERVKADCRIAN